MGLRAFLNQKSFYKDTCRPARDQHHRYRPIEEACAEEEMKLPFTFTVLINDLFLSTALTPKGNCFEERI